MKLDDIILTSQDFLSLKEEIERGSISKSILLFSKDNVYASNFAKMLAVLLLNDGKLQENENYLKVNVNSHPDVKIYPTKEKLLVADSQDIVMEAYIKPIFADKKVFIIKNIDLSMESAQNKLLKILEEPPQNVYFILTCASASLVLPTIKSRCNKIELSKPSISQIKEMFSSSENLNLVSALSDGLIGKAEMLSNKRNLKELFEAVLSIITNMKTSKQVLFFSSKINAFKENFNLIIEILSLIIEDLLLLKAGKQNIRFKDYKSALMQVEGDYTVKAICEIQNLLNKAVKEVYYNANTTVVLENLMLNILEVKYICR